MAKIFVKLILMGTITLVDVPVKWREEVATLLEKTNWEVK